MSTRPTPDYAATAMAAVVDDDTPDEIAIPHGHFSEGQALLIAGALTGDTGMIRQRLDAIAADDE